MCLIGLHLQDHDTYKLIVIANRDEFYERPTKQAGFWEDHPSVLAGRDLVEMGTWMGITTSGKFAALTNYRKLKDHDDSKVSRGEIVSNFLTHDYNPEDYLHKLRQEKDKYNGYNVILGSVDDLYYYGNYQSDIIKVKLGTHGLSNHLFNTPWPKVTQIKTLLNDYVKNNPTFILDDLYSILNKTDLAHDDILPATGIDKELERQLSPIFIETDKYGTRSSTIILVTHDNQVDFHERSYSHNGVKNVNYSFTIK